MAREKDLFGTIEAQARHVLGLIEAEIAEFEERLAKLREQHARWSSVLGGPPAPAAPTRGRRGAAEPASPGKLRRKAAAKPAREPGPSIDWNEVLKGLPGRFTMTDVAAATPALDPNPRARIVAVARWTRAKQVKKIGSGQYEKIFERSRKRADATGGEGAAADPGAEESRSDADVETPAA